MAELIGHLCRTAPHRSTGSREKEECVRACVRASKEQARGGGGRQEVRGVQVFARAVAITVVDPMTL